MARSLTFWLAAPEASQLDPGDIPLALGALLVRVARADFRYVIAEIEMIDAILALRHDLTRAEATEMRRICERLESGAPETERFAQVLRAAVPYGDRLAIALCLWEVMMADGIQHPQEQAVIDLAEAILGIRVQDVGQAYAPA